MHCRRWSFDKRFATRKAL